MYSIYEQYTKHHTILYIYTYTKLLHGVKHFNCKKKIMSTYLVVPTHKVQYFFTPNSTHLLFAQPIFVHPKRRKKGFFKYCHQFEVFTSWGTHYVFNIFNGIVNVFSGFSFPFFKSTESYIFFLI